MDQKAAQQFAREWVEAWNSKDLDRILSHYSDDFVMTSPVICVIANEPTGTLHGKAAVRDYWSRALKANPDLHFELVEVYAGVDSVVIQYRGHRGLSAEVFRFDDLGRVVHASAHYQQVIT